MLGGIEQQEHFVFQVRNRRAKMQGVVALEKTGVISSKIGGRPAKLSHDLREPGVILSNLPAHLGSCPRTYVYAVFLLRQAELGRMVGGGWFPMKHQGLA